MMLLSFQTIKTGRILASRTIKRLPQPPDLRATGRASGLKESDINQFYIMREQKMSNTKVKHFKFSGDVTFSVRIHYRQNASYQGELYWVEKKQKINFRSLLEMIMLMQEALDMAEIPQADYSLRSWKDKLTIAENI